MLKSQNIAFKIVFLQKILFFEQTINHRDNYELSHISIMVLMVLNEIAFTKTKEAHALPPED